LTPAQVGREFEALIRLECQLRLNNYKVEANNLGFVIRASFDDIRKELGKVGVALGLLPSVYRQANVSVSTVESYAGLMESRLHRLSFKSEIVPFLCHHIGEAW
jgi:hypothetical protein